MSPAAGDAKPPAAHGRRAALASGNTALDGRVPKAAARALDRICARLWPPRPVALVTGFWRSGTTWLQQSLADAIRAKTVFEPLSPRNPAYMTFLRTYEFNNYATAEAFMPDLDRGTMVDVLWPYLEDAFRGFCSGHFALLCRRSVGESLRRQVIVKCVRAAWGQRALHARFGVPIVHLRRHPCAVVASLLDVRSWQWSFDHVHLTEAVRHLAEPDPGPAVGLPELARRYDIDAIARIAAYWAMTERHVDGALRGQPWATIVDYDRAVHEPLATVTSIASFLGQPVTGKIQAARESPVTEPHRRALGPSARTRGWQATLAPADIERILGIVGEIFPAVLEAEKPSRHPLACEGASAPG